MADPCDHYKPQYLYHFHCPVCHLFLLQYWYNSYTRKYCSGYSKCIFKRTFRHYPCTIAAAHEKEGERAKRLQPIFRTLINNIVRLYFYLKIFRRFDAGLRSVSLRRCSIENCNNSNTFARMNPIAQKLNIVILLKY